MLELCHLRKMTILLRSLGAGRASGSVEKPEADIVEYIPIFISPPDKSDILNQIVSSSKEDEPFGHKQRDAPDTHPHTSM